MHIKLDIRIGENIRKLREQNGLTVSSLSALTDLDEGRLEEIECGKVKATAEELYALKTALKTEVKDFYAGL